MRTKPTARRCSGGRQPTSPSTNTESTFGVEETVHKQNTKRAGTLASLPRQQIRKWRRNTDTLLDKQPFMWLLREVMDRFNADLRVNKSAVLALQEAAEAYLLGLFEDSQLCASHDKRKTVQPKEMRLVINIRNRNNNASADFAAECSTRKPPAACVGEAAGQQQQQPQQQQQQPPPMLASPSRMPIGGVPAACGAASSTEDMSEDGVGSVGDGAAAKQPQQELQQQQQQQQQPQHVVFSPHHMPNSGNDAPDGADTSAAEAAAAPPFSAVAPAAAPATTAAAAGATALGPSALAVVKQELGALPCQQQLQYWQLADLPFNEQELQQLVKDYMEERKLANGVRTNRSGLSRAVFTATHDRLHQQYPLLAPKLHQLLEETQAEQQQESVQGAAAAAQGCSSLTAPPVVLLRALRCLKLREQRQATDHDMPTMLQRMTPGAAAAAAAAAEAGSDANEVNGRDVIDLSSYSDGEEDAGRAVQESEQLQAFLAGQCDVLLDREVAGQQGAAAAAVKPKPWG